MIFKSKKIFIRKMFSVKIRQVIHNYLWLIFLLVSISFVYAENEIVRDGPRAMISLNGNWQMHPIRGLNFAYPPPSDGWEIEKVPHISASAIKTIGGPYAPPISKLLNKQGNDYLQKDKLAAWFKRKVFIPEDIIKQKRVILYFEGMAFKSETWFNGNKLGVSYLGQVPIEYDVTKYVKPNMENEILVGLAGREALLDIKNKTYIAPSSGTCAGIWGNVELRFLPETYIEDIFIKTSVKNKCIDVDVTLINKGKVKKQIIVDALITDKVNNPHCKIDGIKVILNACEKKVITLHKNWIAPQLWSPETPALYFVKVMIKKDKKIIDKKLVRFGFREFEIRGRDFYLNGKRIVLRRKSYLTTLGASYESFLNNQSRSNGIPLRGEAGRECNCIRLHLGFNNKLILDTADELGVMVIPESAWHNISGKFDITKSELWLPNVLAYTKSLIKMHRNRPSIIIWSLTNESFWEKTDSIRMAIADKILGAAKEMDPTRPQQGDGETYWGKRLPVINIHYPLGEAGILRKKYPNSGYVFPNDLYWLSKEKINSSWRANFEWDRPLIIGEYWNICGGVDDKSSFMGEAAYDWEKWRFQDIRGRDNYIENGYMDALKMMTDVYRMEGVAGINPWSGNSEEIMPSVAVRPVDFHPNFFGGTIGVRKVVIFNDSGRNFDDMNLQCCLVVNNKSIWKKIIKVNVPSGQCKKLDIPIEFPSVSNPIKGKLTIRLRMWAAGGYHQISRHEENIFIMPKENLSRMNTKDIVLLDSSGKTAKGLEYIGLKLNPKKTLNSDELKNADVLIIGRNTNSAPFKDIILKFVQTGGKVIIFQQDKWNPIVSDLPEIDEKHVATRSWKRYYNHPITKDFDDKQFSYWRPDNLVSTKTFYKPSVGKFKILLDAGGLYGLRWTPLIEIPYGEGVFLMSQLNLIDRVMVEPIVGKLIGNMIKYCKNFHPTTRYPLRILIGKNTPLKQTLAACGIVTTPYSSVSNIGPIFIDSSYTPSSEELSKIRVYLEKGGKVWLHGFSPKTISRVSTLLPFKPEMTTFDQTIQAGARRSDVSLINNLSSFDFFWTKVNLSARKDFFQSAHPTAKLGKYVLKLPSLESGEYLIEPGLLVKIPVEKGIILFDTLLWEKALGAESDKVSRIVSSIASNLSVDIQFTHEKKYSYFYIDISKYTNMGFYDKVAGDEKGGWTDQGENDMRYFLINHTGKVNGMEVPVGKFPTLVRFAEIPFSLIDPEENSGCSVITLRGSNHCENLPEKVIGIHVGKKADKLWFLQASAWATEENYGQKIAYYVIHYEDGEKITFPIRYGIEISDWWNPQPLPGAKVAWTGKNPVHSPVGIYATEWKNPYPKKIIKSIDLIGNLTQTQIILLAITGGIEKKDLQNNLTLISKWNFADVKDSNLIPNQVKGMGCLKFGKLNPTLVKLQDKTVLRFRKGQFLIGNSKEIPELYNGHPFILDVVLAPEEKPLGYYGGIFQCMNYGKSGFRLCIDQHMKIVVEFFTGPGQHRVIRGKSVLTRDRFYKIRVKFDGIRGYIFLNNKLDGVVDSPPPAPCKGEILIGRASGKNYDFNGLISEISILGITENR